MARTRDLKRGQRRGIAFNPDFIFRPLTNEEISYFHSYLRSDTAKAHASELLEKFSGAVEWICGAELIDHLRPHEREIAIAIESIGQVATTLLERLVDPLNRTDGRVTSADYHAAMHAMLGMTKIGRSPSGFSDLIELVDTLKATCEKESKKFRVKSTSKMKLENTNYLMLFHLIHQDLESVYENCRLPSNSSLDNIGSRPYHDLCRLAVTCVAERFRDPIMKDEPAVGTALHRAESIENLGSKAFVTLLRRARTWSPSDYLMGPRTAVSGP